MLFWELNYREATSNFLIIEKLVQTNRDACREESIDARHWNDEAVLFQHF